MSLVREAARLPLRSCLQAVNANCQREVKRQDNFEGVFNPFLWNEKTGFGLSKKGHTVLISQEYGKRDLSTKSESDIWQDIIEPTSYICHEYLRDELQLGVLAYDDDVVKHDSLTDKTSVHTLPIYRGDITMITSHNGNSPGGENTGCNGGSRTLTV